MHQVSSVRHKNTHICDRSTAFSSDENHDENRAIHLTTKSRYIETTPAFCKYIKHTLIFRQLSQNAQILEQHQEGDRQLFEALMIL